MSLSDSNQNVRTYPVIASSQSQVPQELMSSSAPRPLSSKIQHKVSNCQTATQTSSGQLMFNLGCGAGQGFLKSGSVYLSCTVGVTKADGTWGFQNSNQLASAIILRDTLYFNGNITDQYNYVNKLRQGLVSHCSSENYVKNDLALSENSNSNSIPFGSTVNVCIPVQNGALNAQHNLPLFLANTVQLEINLENLNNAVSNTAGGAAITEYTVSNAKIMYTVIQPEVSFEQEMKSILASGKLFQMPIKSWYNLKVSNTGAVKSVPVGLNMSSVNGVFHTCYPVAAMGAIQNNYANQAANATNFRVWCDGELKTNYNIDQYPVQFAELKKALGVFGDPERSSAAHSTGNGVLVSPDGTLANSLGVYYQTKSFLGGLCLLRTQESGFEMSGTPVSQLLCEISNTGTDGDLFIFVSYSQILTIDMNGSIQLIR